MSEQTTVQISAQTANDLVKALNEHKTLSDTVKAELATIKEANSATVEKLEKVSTDITKQLADAKAATDKTVEQVEEFRLQLNRAIKEQGETREGKSLGEQYVNSEEFKTFFSGGIKATSGFHAHKTYDKKDIVTTPANTLIVTAPQRLSGVLKDPDQELTIRDLIPTGRTTSKVIEFVREQSFTNSAGPQYSPSTSPAQIDSAKKRKSDLTYEIEQVSVTTLAHYMKVSRQMLDDVSFIASEIDNRLRYGLKLEEERELLFGSGIQGELLGLVPQSTPYNTGLNVTDDTKIDKARHAVLQLALKKYIATGFVMSVKDWHDIEVSKDGYKRYLVGNPVGVAGKRLWGLPVVDSLSLSNNSLLTADFRQAAQIFDRMELSVATGWENDDFTRNMVTILCEERLALAVYQPDALVFANGTFTA